MAGIPKGLNHFSAAAKATRGTNQHWAITLKGQRAIPQGPGGILRTPEAAKELRETLLPHYMKTAGIQDLTKQGFRLVVEAASSLSAPEIHLISGTRVAAQNPQDWLSPSVKWDPKAPAVFFEKCTEAAVLGNETMAFGNRMLYVEGTRNIFGIMDGDPKSETHFLVLASDIFGNFMDNGFTAKHLNRFFETAFQITRTLNLLDQPIRYVANIGTGFQVGPRVHMHVQIAREGFPSMFPHDYGFSVTEKGTIMAPDGTEIRGEVIRLIKTRQEVTGFSAEAAAQRKGIDRLLINQLGQMR